MNFEREVKRYRAAFYTCAQNVSACLSPLQQGGAVVWAEALDTDSCDWRCQGCGSTAYTV